MIGPIIAACGLLLTLCIVAAGAIMAYGKNVQALTMLTVEVTSMRGTLQRFGERLGRLEARYDAQLEMSRGHRPLFPEPDTGGIPR